MGLRLRVQVKGLRLRDYGFKVKGLWGQGFKGVRTKEIHTIKKQHLTSRRLCVFLVLCLFIVW